jgi:mersacidin/lichenicidin family type 2 lantibiotic
MPNVNVIRAGRGEEPRPGLTDAECARLPEQLTGPVALPEDQLDQVAGGAFIGPSWLSLVPIPWAAGL